ncbi:hypothetical protein IKB17_01175 [bacterium]|nr:hypothetical protein [bacterium]
MTVRFNSGIGPNNDGAANVRAKKDELEARKKSLQEEIEKYPEGSPNRVVLEHELNQVQEQLNNLPPIPTEKTYKKFNLELFKENIQNDPRYQEIKKRLGNSSIF